MFKKPNRAKNIRRKIETSDDESKTDEPVVAKTTLKSKSDKKKTKKGLGLSFDQQDDEDAGEVFQVKKSKASRKMASERKLHVPNMPGATLEDTTSSTYNDDYLASLRANTPTLPTNLKNATNDEDSVLVAEKFPKTMNARLTGGTGIPDSNAIHAAKKKRELMRQGVVVVDNEQDFIGLDESNGGSRLVREDDDVGDDGEEEFERYGGERMTLDKDEAKKQEQEQRKDARDMIYDAQDYDNESDSDELDEIDRWERDLIKHGGVRVKYDEQVVDPYATPRGYQPAIVPESSTLPTLDDVLQRLDLISTDITYSIRQYESQLSDTQKGMVDLKVTMEDLDREIEHGSQRFDYFQSLSNTVNDLGEFLDVKIPMLERFEKEAHDVILAKREVVEERRWLDDVDLLSSFATVPEHVLQGEDTEMVVDEFGRTPESKFSDISRQRRQSERQERMQRYQTSTENEQKELAYWSDDDLQGGWQERKDQTLDNIQINKMDELFDDVGDEFKSLGAVKLFFEAWKTQFYEDYKNAFGSLSLPAAFEFYVRCELVAWDPFSDPIEFDSMNWHSTLSSYGIVDGLEGHEDADVELLNKVVEKVVLKKVKNLLDTMNPVSSKETRYAVQAVEQISYYVEKHERSFQDLIMEVERVIEKPLERYARLVESATLLDDQQHDNKRVFIWRQQKYLKNLNSWRRYIPKDRLLSLGQMIVHRNVMPLLKPDLIPGDGDLENETLALYTLLEH